MTKAELRHKIRKLKADYSEEFPKWSEAICRKVINHPLWQENNTVLLYHALADEPQLATLLQHALNEGKLVLLPVVEDDHLILRRYEGVSSLREGAFHIMEPIGETFPRERYYEIGLVIVPGMAFDRDGHRLGRGKGYYDKLLPMLPNAKKWGICFPFQLFDSIPFESHDVLMDCVLCVV